MTYVTEQTPKELRQHMRQLQKMPGWHAPLDDRLFKEIESQDAEIERLRAGYTSIMAAVVAGRVCDDVVWFDTITTLYEYCDAMLAGNEHLFADADHHMAEGAENGRDLSTSRGARHVCVSAMIQQEDCGGPYQPEAEPVPVWFGVSVVVIVGGGLGWLLGLAWNWG